MQAEMLDSVVSSHSQELSNASSAIKLFENPLFKVRVIMRCAEPWFVAKDVATCIEHSDTSAMCKLCREKDVAIVNGKEYSADLAEYSKGFSDDSSENYQTNSSHRGRTLLPPCNAKRAEPCAQQALF